MAGESLAVAPAAPLPAEEVVQITDMQGQAMVKMMTVVRLLTNRLEKATVFVLL